MKHCPICGRTFPAAEQFCSVHGLPLVMDLTMEGGAKGALSGTVLEGRYRIGGVVGAGGMGVVYEAEHLRIGRRCAVKVLFGHQAADPKVRMRFFREVQATSRVRHPNVVEILDFGEDSEAGCFMVMEYLDGKSLRKLLDEGAPLPLPAACALVVQICSALGATHAQGLIHRDLKPANVVRLSSGTVKVLDFGLVKPIEKSSSEPTVTTGSMLVGTPWFMSPEHCKGEELDARADVYSLGVMLYEMMTGRLPFEGNHPFELIAKHLNEPIPLPSSLDPPVSLPPAAEMILIKALAKDRTERYQSMHELADAIYRLAAEQDFSISELEPIAASEIRERRERREDSSRETMRWGGGPAPVAAPTPPLHQLRELADKRLDDLVERSLAALLKAFPRCRSLDEAILRRGFERAQRQAFDALVVDTAELEAAGAAGPSPQDLLVGQLTLSELVTALWLGYTMWRPLLLEFADNDLERYRELADRFDQRILPFYFGVVDRNISAVEDQLQGLNETFARQNDELQGLRASLSRQVEQTSRQLADSERVKARVAEAVSSALILVERGTRRILLWNKAAERISGISASQVVGEPIDSVAHLVSGIPFDEFAEQNLLHQEVGLRKLRVTFAGKEPRTVYVKGQGLLGVGGEHLGTLFTFDDVTEREQVVESLGRYLSKDLVSRLMSSGGAPRPDGQLRRAVVLAVRARGLGALIATLDPGEVVGVMSEYVRAVAHAIFQRGGSIERISKDGLLAYFPRVGTDLTPTVEVAVELAGRLKLLGTSVRGGQGPALRIGVGLHVGEVLLLDVGGDRLMVHTVVGEATRVVEALQDAAGDGEILASAELVESVAGVMAFKGCPELRVEGRAAPVRPYLLVSSPSPDLSLEPSTYVARKPS
jgi:PAS domain S-box-containing protein